MQRLEVATKVAAAQIRHGAVNDINRTADEITRRTIRRKTIALFRGNGFRRGGRSRLLMRSELLQHRDIDSWLDKHEA